VPQAAGKVIAGCFALTAFAVAVFAGLLANNPMLDILVRATMSMVICYPLGFLVGLIVEHVVAQHVREFVHANPVPDSSILDSFMSGEAPATGGARPPAGAGEPEDLEEVIEA